jgi:hypothetical protein
MLKAMSSCSSFVTGPYSRTAESHLSELINGGLTTVIGILGTDGATRRSVECLYFFQPHNRALENDVENCDGSIYPFVLFYFSLSSLLQKMKVSLFNLK